MLRERKGQQISRRRAFASGGACGGPLNRHRRPHPGHTYLSTPGGPCRTRGHRDRRRSPSRASAAPAERRQTTRRAAASRAAPRRPTCTQGIGCKWGRCRRQGLAAFFKIDFKIVWVWLQNQFDQNTLGLGSKESSGRQGQLPASALCHVPSLAGHSLPTDTYALWFSSGTW